MGNILEQIVDTKRREIAASRARHPLAEVKAAARAASPARDFHGALAAAAPRSIHLIAEIKRKSPSAGLIRADFDPVTLARTYHEYQASALSVLTDETYFDGRLAFLKQVRQAVPLPVLRKDFVLEDYQVYESRAAGADAILLIGEVLESRQVRDLMQLAFELGMTTLVEVHERKTLEDLLTIVSFPNPYRSVLGVNNRNLKLQQTDLSTTQRLAGLVGPGTILVSESGIKTRDDVERLRTAGARALLIGETFMRADDIGAKIEELLPASPS